jgi:hypothetical protein
MGILPMRTAKMAVLRPAQPPGGRLNLLTDLQLRTLVLCNINQLYKSGDFAMLSSCVQDAPRSRWF